MKRSLIIGLVLLVLLIGLTVYFAGQSQKVVEKSDQPMVKADSAQVTEKKPETYVVVKGDCLWNLSRQTFKERGIDIEDWLKVNPQIKDEDLIIIGWNLVVPAKKETAEKGTQKKAETKPRPKKKDKKGFSWLHPNREPFNGRDMSKMIDKFNVPAWVKEEWKKKIAAGEYELFMIYNGLHLNEMAFGEYKLRKKVTVRWLECYSKVMRQAKVYIAEDGQTAYYLVDPDVCHNIGWWVEEAGKAEIKKEEEKKEVVTPLKPVEEIKAEEVKPEEKPVEVEKKEEVKKEAPVVAPVKKPAPKKCVFGFDFESSSYGGFYNFHQGWGGEYGFWGNDTSIFVGECNTPKSVYRLGPSFQFLRYDGEIGNDIMPFRGEEKAYGLEIQRITDSNKTSFKLRKGKKYGYSWADKKRYSSGEAAEIINIESYRQWFYERQLFPLLMVRVSADLAYHNRKDSYYQNSRLSYKQDSPRDQSEYSIGFRGDIYDGEILTPFADIPIGYRAYDERYYVEPTAGVKIKLFGKKDILELTSSYQLVDGRHNDGYKIIGVMLNIHKIFEE